MPAPVLGPISRRQLLVGGCATAGVALLGACGDSGGDDPAATGSPAGDLALVQFFGGLPMLVAGREVRAPFGLADGDGLLPVERTPDELTVTVLGPAGDTAVGPLTVARRAKGLPRAYFPLRFTVEEPGIYTGRSEVDGEALEMAIKVDTTEDVRVIQPGTAMPSIETPTTADARGVDPVCTRDPVCPLHEVTVAEALTERRPLAFLVATPAFCQTEICGPVLEVLLSVVDAHPDIRFLHAEVYVNPQQDLDVQTAALTELGLTFEPSLVLVGSDGRVLERLDTVYDEGELGEALSRLT